MELDKLEIHQLDSLGTFVISLHGFEGRIYLQFNTIKMEALSLDTSNPHNIKSDFRKLAIIDECVG